MTDEADQDSPSPTRPEAPLPPTTPAAPWTPGYVHLAVVSIVTLALDLGTKQWAKARLDIASGGTPMDVIHDHLRFAFAKNPGGAFGLLQDEPETIRRPFFLGISVLAVAFIVSLYRKLTPQQWALKWGLPLVLGGALGNLIDRIQARHVIDFIDYRADWVRSLYGLFSRYPTDHWPTFNIADVAIVAGVGLMAVDMFTPRKATAGGAAVPTDAASSGLPSAQPAPSGAVAPAATPEPPHTGHTGSDAPEPVGEPEPAPKET
jgi:signal peptidase II